MWIFHKEAAFTTVVAGRIERERGHWTHNHYSTDCATSTGGSKATVTLDICFLGPLEFNLVGFWVTKIIPSHFILVYFGLADQSLDITVILASLFHLYAFDMFSIVWVKTSLVVPAEVPPGAVCNIL